MLCEREKEYERERERETVQFVKVESDGERKPPPPHSPQAPHTYHSSSYWSVWKHFWFFFFGGGGGRGVESSLWRWGPHPSKVSSFSPTLTIHKHTQGKKVFDLMCLFCSYLLSSLFPTFSAAFFSKIHLVSPQIWPIPAMSYRSIDRSSIAPSNPVDSTSQKQTIFLVLQ